MARHAYPDAKLPTGEADFLRLARERYERAWQFERENRTAALQDQQFRAGDQWDADIQSARKEDQRPALTINLLPQYIRQVTGDIRINKPAVKVRPVDDVSDPEIARLYTGLIRNIEQASDAPSAYTTAAENAAVGGEGAFRLVTEYADNDAFDQDIRIRRIRNPFAVLWDPDAQMETREDAKYCFVLERYSKEEFKAAWPEASMADFESDEPADHIKDWYDGETVLVAEYWCKKPRKRRLAQIAGGEVRDVTGMGDVELSGEEFIGARYRDVDSHVIEQHFISGVERLEDPYEWPGRYIPIIPVFGEEVNVGEKIVRHGLVRFAKDPQRMYNYHKSAAVETIALAPKAPFVGTVQQFENLDRFWSRANTANLPYLPYNSDPAAPGAPQRQRSPEVPVAALAEANASREDMEGTTGIYKSSLGARSNEVSGKAIVARERQGDVGTFVYIDNLARAIAYCGRQLVDLIPKIYDGERVVRILGEDDSEELVKINAIELDQETGQIVLKNDLGAGKYDVSVSTGPSYSTKRQEAADSMMQFVQFAPQTADLVIDLIAKNMDWPGADEFEERFRRMLIARGVIEPNEDEEPAPAPQPSPDDIKAQAATAKSAADIEKIKAQTEGQMLENMEKALALALQSGQMQQIIEREVGRTLMAMAMSQPRSSPMMPADLVQDPNGGGTAGF